MRIFFLVVTIALQILFVFFGIKILDDFKAVLGIIAYSILLGLAMKYFSSRPILKSLGWGLLYGSLVGMAGVLATMFFLSKHGN